MTLSCDSLNWRPALGTWIQPRSQALSPLPPLSLGGERAWKRGWTESFFVFCFCNATHDCSAHVSSILSPCFRAIFVWPWKTVSVRVRYMFHPPLESNIKTELRSFPAKGNPNMETALFDCPIVLSNTGWRQKEISLDSRKFSRIRSCGCRVGVESVSSCIECEVCSALFLACKSVAFYEIPFIKQQGKQYAWLVVKP